jgi:hypothetical protein
MAPTPSLQRAPALLLVLCLLGAALVAAGSYGQTYRPAAAGEGAGWLPENRPL